MDYTDYLKDVINDLKETMSLAKQAGIKKEKIMIDPGIGFAKTLEQNRLLMKHLELLNEFEVPVLLGTSRKSMIGLTLDLPVDQREEGRSLRRDGLYGRMPIFPRSQCGSQLSCIKDDRSNLQSAVEERIWRIIVRIRDLEVYANHGVFEEENRLGQKFFIFL